MTARVDGDEGTRVVTTVLARRALQALLGPWQVIRESQFASRCASARNGATAEACPGDRGRRVPRAR